MVSKVGRNDPCPCGSGKKFKHCCGNGKYAKATVNTPKKKMLNQLGLNRCFLKLVKDAGGEMDISCEDIDAIPKEEVLGIRHDVETDAFHFEVVKVKQGKVLQPRKELILPN